MEMATYEDKYSHLGSKFNLPIIVFLMNVKFFGMYVKENWKVVVFYVGWIY